jgi:hypothetical protein
MMLGQVAGRLTHSNHLACPTRGAGYKLDGRASRKGCHKNNSMYVSNLQPFSLMLNRVFAARKALK